MPQHFSYNRSRGICKKKPSIDEIEPRNQSFGRALIRLKIALNNKVKK